ncbi:MAG: hypothetical protein ACOYJH_05815 [Anaerovoracaceae bacterium]|jgi:hypothetical protein
MGKRVLITVLLAAFVLTNFFIFPGKTGSAYTSSNFTATGVTVPSSTMQYGKSFSIRGTVKTKSSRQVISKLTVGVTNASGKWISGKYASVKPKTVSYSLKNLDSKIKFGSLKPGSYRYVVSATTSAGKTEKIVNSAFRVRSILVSGANSPSDMYYGSSFSVKGTVTSTYNLKQVRVGVTDSSGNFLKGHYVTKKTSAKQFSIASVKSSMNFSTVGTGTHYYKVIAWDSKGNSATLVNRRFTVSRFTLSNTKSPSSLKVGNSFSVKGTVKSSYRIKSISVGVQQTSGKWVSGVYKTVSPNTNTYDLSNLSSGLKFEKLSKGTYLYRIRMTDARGITKYVYSKKFSVVSTISVSSVRSPSALYYGSSYSISGTIKSTYNLKQVRIGITDSSGKFMRGHYVTKTTSAKQFSIASVKSSMNFSTVGTGTHYYKVIAWDSKGETDTLVNRRFTVSRFRISNAKSPSSLAAGNSFSVVGTVNSTYRITSITVGVQKSSGKWVSGVYKSASPNTNSYDLSNLDSSVKFGKLSKGTYKYRVRVTDTHGITKYVLTKSFKVVSSSSGSSGGRAALNSNGEKLSYSKSVFRSIGKQPYSGPCGGYAMAYGRMVIDGKFSLTDPRNYKVTYSSAREKIIKCYCMNCNMAYWGLAGAYSTYTSSTKYANQQVLNQVASGKPAIIAVCTRSSTNHYVTVIGYRAGTTYSNVSINSFIILDPAYGTERRIAGSEYLDKTVRGMTPQFIIFKN